MMNMVAFGKSFRAWRHSVRPRPSVKAIATYCGIPRCDYRRFEAGKFELDADALKLLRDYKAIIDREVRERSWVGTFSK